MMSGQRAAGCGYLDQSEWAEGAPGIGGREGIGSADHDLVGADIAQDRACLFIEQVEVEVFV